MGRTRPSRVAVAVLLLPAVSGLVAGCRSPLVGDARSATPGPAPVVVASFNFDESELLAAIYAQALEHAGVPVRLELDLGPREQVMPAVREGLVDLVPEYLGSALIAVQPDANESGRSADVLAADLQAAVAPWHVRVLARAPAQDQNGLAVTASTAARLALHAVSDLRSFATDLALTGPSECPARPFCLPGYRDVYGLQFGQFLALDAERQRVAALQENSADVAVLFTTDGQLATGDFVLLADDRHLQPPENVVPLLSSRAITTYGDRVVQTIDAVSAKLTTQALVFLNWRVAIAGDAVAGEATGWLQREGLIPRPPRRP